METSVTYFKFPGRLNWRWLPALLLSFICVGNTAVAQSLLAESFDGTTFAPTGWNVINGASNYNAVGYSYIGWERTTSSGVAGQSPVPSTHSGAGMAWFGSYWIGTGSWSELVTPAIDFSTTSGTKQVSFWTYRTNSSTSDSLSVWVNTSAISSGGTRIAALRPTNGAPAGWTQYVLTIPASYTGTTNYIIFRARSAYGYDMFLDDVMVYNIGPCTGPVSAGSISPSGTQTVCPGSSLNLSVSGYGIAANTSMGWQYSTNGGTSWNFVPGAYAPTYTTFPITKATLFRFYNACNNTGDTSWSSNVTVNVTGSGAFPQYASLPFSESFESWTNGCSTNDLPSYNWTQSYSSGNQSFRRNDQGSNASWTSATSGSYTPAAAVGSYSARFHAYYAYNRSQGSMSCYVDCSAAGNKELQFYLITPSPSYSYTMDSCYVDYSTDGGVTFTNLARYGLGTGGWDFKTLTLPSNSPTTVVRWTMWQQYQYCCYYDMGIDGVRILPPCSSTPVAGTIDSVTACVGKNFKLKLTGTSATAGLAYQWQYKATGSTVGWSNLPGGNVASPTANISVPTSFRAIVSCTNTTPNVSDTSAVYDVKIDPFYYCYCDMPTSINYPYNYSAIGNVSISKRPSGAVLMSNTSGVTPPYISYARTVAPPTLIRDSTYRFSMTNLPGLNGTVSPGYVGMFLDVNRNGIWDLPAERIYAGSTSGSGQTVFKDYAIPSNAATGLTGYRVIHAYVTTSPINPCGSMYYIGECEDYLVYLEYQPCDGPVNPGTTYISDTLVCPGYTVDLWNTTYEKQRTGIVRTWEVSTNLGASYSAIAGSTNKDTLYNVVVTPSSYGLRYRLRTICSNTGDTTYSNAVSVTNPPAYSCYPFASALPPGTADSSDIGTFVIGPYATPYVNPHPMTVSGPHLMNPAANRRRTDYTRLSPTWTLAADSTYRIAVYHTMRSANHADALVSVFIDFNHDGQYTETSPGYPYPPELIYRGRTTAANFYLDTVFKMPSDLIPNVPTGLRVVLNNDLNPFGSGNTGTGGFTSGEVEDYILILTRTNLGVEGNGGAIQNLSLFPNPTSNKATVVFDAPTPIAQLQMNVTTISGQSVLSRSFDNVGSHFSAEIDLSGKAKGIYFVELKTEQGQKITRKLVLQ